MATIDLHNLEGQKIGSLPVPKSMEGPVDKTLLWQAARMYLANKREGTADTKTRGEVSGGGKKPWAQKHTGRARHGSIRSPIWRKGGIVFGPHPREYRYQLPAKIRLRALVESLKAKMGDQAVKAVESLEPLPPKTKALGRLLQVMDARDGALLVTDRPSPLLARISRNLPRVAVKPASDVTCYDVLSHRQMVITSEGLKQLEARVG